MKNLLVATIVGGLAASTAMAGNTPIMDSLSWTIYDDFNNQENASKWDISNDRTGFRYENGGGTLYTSPSGPSRFSAISSCENVSGIMADLTLEPRFSWSHEGSGTLMIGVQVFPDFYLTFGFNSPFVSQDSQPYHLSIIASGRGFGEQEIVEDEEVEYGRSYNLAIFTEESGNWVHFYLDRTMFASVEFNLRPTITGFSINGETVDSGMKYTTDNFCVAVPEPATFLLIGLGGLICRKH